MTSREQTDFRFGAEERALLEAARRERMPVELERAARAALERQLGALPAR